MREVAEILSLSRQQVYNLLAQGEVPCVHFGKSKRIPIPALDDYLANKLAAAQGWKVEVGIESPPPFPIFT